MTDRLDNLEARMIATEIFVRSILTGMVARSADPIGEIDRMAEQFRESSGFIVIAGSDDDQAERMRDLIRARGIEYFDAVRSRIFRDIEIEAAKAGKRN
jgi:hypothetical protein